MMADIEDKAHEALSIHELDAASKLGMNVISSCPYCHRPSLWIKGSMMPMAPITCGRQKCLEAHAEGLK